MNLRFQQPIGASGRKTGIRGSVAPDCTRNARRMSGLTLVEMAVALGIGSLVLLVVTAMSVYALRSFVAMGNYASLDTKNRLAVDRITRDIQQATGVVGFDQSGDVRWLKLTNAALGITLKYTWYADERVLECERTGQATQVYLTECDQWDFTLYQRTARPNAATAFFPATGPSGNPDPAIAKAVEMSWKCSRLLLGKKWNTESVQTARIALRNKL